MSAMIQTPTAWSFPDARFSRMASVEELDTNLNNLTRLSRRFSIRGGEGSENGSPTTAARPMPMTPPGTPSVARSPEEGDKFKYDAPASPPVRTSIPPNTPVTPAAAAAFCSASRGQGEGSSSSAVSAIGGANVVAIDNKIEQAMDLVKTHLTFAVREEVEILRSTIVDLEARVAGLEQQNQYLRQFVPAEVLANLAIISRQPPAGTPTHTTPSIAPLPAPKTVPSGTFCPATATLASTLNTVVAEGKSPKMNH